MMKKLISLLSICASMLTGCNTSKNEPAVTEPSETTTTAVQVTTVGTTTAATTTLKETEAKTEAKTETITTETTTEAPTETTTEISTTTLTTAQLETQTETTTEPEKENEMPEIVFITIENQLSAENVAYGHYINNKGEVRYFEYLDEKAEKYAEEKKKEDYSYWPYMYNFMYREFSANLIDEMYDTIISTSTDTGERVELSKLNELYDKLMTVDANQEIENETEEYSLGITHVVAHNYAIRYTKDKTNEKIFLYGGGSYRFVSLNDTANEIMNELNEYFPYIKIEYIPKLLQDKDENKNTDNE